MHLGENKESVSITLLWALSSGVSWSGSELKLTIRPFLCFLYCCCVGARLSPVLPTVCLGALSWWCGRTSPLKKAFLLLLVSPVLIILPLSAFFGISSVPLIVFCSDLFPAWKGFIHRLFPPFLTFLRVSYFSKGSAAMEFSMLTSNSDLFK